MEPYFRGLASGFIPESFGLADWFKAYARRAAIDARLAFPCLARFAIDARLSPELHGFRSCLAMLPRKPRSAPASLAGLKPAAAASPAGLKPAAAAAPSPHKKNFRLRRRSGRRSTRACSPPTPCPSEDLKGSPAFPPKAETPPEGGPPPEGRRPLMSKLAPKLLEIFGFHSRIFLAGRAGPLRPALGRRFWANSPHVWRLEISRSAGHAQPLQGS